RFIHFYGQPAARLDRDRSVHQQNGRQKRRPWWMSCLSPVLFSAPDLYYRMLSKIWVDSFVHGTAWNDFMQALVNDWQQVALFNTVLLNANVAFLAIQSIDISSDIPQRSPAQIASFISTFASCGSMILGLVLARIHRAKDRNEVESAIYTSNSHNGKAILAVLYSTPYVLLLWGIIFFFIAFSFMCYTDSDAFVRTLMSCAWFVIIMLGLWCVM
ncbi:hypothetical protein EV361DRAFT_770250, partial [Lentinula raphanica]